MDKCFNIYYFEMNDPTIETYDKIDRNFCDIC